MSRYDVWLFLHVTSVIVWLGTGTTLALIGIYAERARDDAIGERLGAVAAWFGRRPVRCAPDQERNSAVSSPSASSSASS